MITLFVVSSCRKSNLPDTDEPKVEYKKVADERIFYTWDNYKRPVDIAMRYGKNRSLNTKSQVSNVVKDVQFITSSKPIKTKSGAVEYSETNATDTVMYVINYANDGGFIIATTDYRTTPVIAMSEKGNFDVENMPDNVRFVIDLAKDNYYYELEEFERKREEIGEEELQRVKEQYPGYRMYTTPSYASKCNGDYGYDNPNEIDMPAPPDDNGYTSQSLKSIPFLQ